MPLFLTLSSRRRRHANRAEVRRPHPVFLTVLQPPDRDQALQITVNSRWTNTNESLSSADVVQQVLRPHSLDSCGIAITLSSRILFLVRACERRRAVELRNEMESRRRFGRT